MDKVKANCGCQKGRSASGQASRRKRTANFLIASPPTVTAHNSVHSTIDNTIAPLYNTQDRSFLNHLIVQVSTLPRDLGDSRTIVHGGVQHGSTSWPVTINLKLQNLIIVHISTPTTITTCIITTTIVQVYDQVYRCWSYQVGDHIEGPNTIVRGIRSSRTYLRQPATVHLLTRIQVEHSSLDEDQGHKP